MFSERHVGYLRVRLEFFRCRFAQRLAPTLAMMAPDRTRRALSVALVDLSKEPSLMSQKCELPCQMYPKLSISRSDSPNAWLQLHRALSGAIIARVVASR